MAPEEIERFLFNPVQRNHARCFATADVISSIYRPLLWDGGPNATQGRPHRSESRTQPSARCLQLRHSLRSESTRLYKAIPKAYFGDIYSFRLANRALSFGLFFSGFCKIFVPLEKPKSRCRRYLRNDAAFLVYRGNEPFRKLSISFPNCMRGNRGFHYLATNRATTNSLPC